jgi:hypothetical protein
MFWPQIGKNSDYFGGKLSQIAKWQKANKTSGDNIDPGVLFFSTIPWKYGQGGA